MLPVFQLSTFLKVKQIRIHDWVFILHSRFTVILLFAFIFFISTKQYFGDPIICLFEKSFSKEYVENYCWTLGLYIFDYDYLDNGTTVNWNGSYIRNGQGSNYISYGVGAKYAGGPKIFMRYYQWIALFLFGQAMFFYFPSYLWKVFENGRIAQLCEKITSCTLSKDVISEQKAILAKYLNGYNKYTHWNYSARYHFCTILNMVLCLLNIWLMDLFFNDFWANYFDAISTIGTNEYKFWSARTSKIFPKVAKCDINTYGHSGSLQNLDALCLLPLNILNEKIFAFLYLWFIFLTFLSIINCVFYVCTIFCERLRFHLIYCHARGLGAHVVTKVIHGLDYGDWFVLYKLSSNVNQELFGDLIEDLYKEKKGLH
ncbi:hypothetical protein ACFFRR_001876 [Megaselia abdita]